MKPDHATPDAQGVIVIGGAGFIGRHLVATLLAMGKSVVVVDPAVHIGDPRAAKSIVGGNNVTYHPWRSGSPAIRDLLECTETIFHCGFRTGHKLSMDDPEGDLESNCLQSVKLFKNLIGANWRGKVVVCSTRQIYGSSREPAVESQPSFPPDFNAIHFLAVEEYAALYSRLTGGRSVILRLPNVIGPGMAIEDDMSGVAGHWMGRASRGETIQVYGDGTSLRDFLYVDDCVSALVHASEVASNESPVFNVAGVQPRTLKDLAGLIAKVAGATVREVPMPHDLDAIAVSDLVIDDSAFRSCTKWSPRTPLEEAVALTWQSIQANMAGLDK